MAVIDPDTAFWSLVAKEKLADALSDGALLKAYGKKKAQFAEEMDHLRFGLTPSAVYFNPTERCNMDCTYCYIPDTMRRDGKHMTEKKLLSALGILKTYFRETLPKDATPQIIFHGAEPLLNRDAVFAGIDAYRDDFRFGIQTNATLLDDKAVEFLTSRRVSVGLSLDAPSAAIADRTRKNWQGKGIFREVVSAMERLKCYDGWSVICTVTAANLQHLTRLVDFFHEKEVPHLPDEHPALHPFRRRGPSSPAMRRRPSISWRPSTAPTSCTSRRGADCPWATSPTSCLPSSPRQREGSCATYRPAAAAGASSPWPPNGDMFPCSEFIGLDHFRAGDLFKGRYFLRSQQPGLQSGDGPERREHRALPALRHPSFLRIALSGRGLRDERRDGQDGGPSASSTRSRCGMRSASSQTGRWTRTCGTAGTRA